MIDALGAPQSMLVLGATSDIASATVTAVAARGRLNRVVLAARPTPAREAEAERVRGLGVADVSVHDFDALTVDEHGALIDSAFAAGDIDVVLVAFGVLPEQAPLDQDPDVAVRTGLVNYIGAVSVCVRAAAHLRRQGHGVLVVLSSVAGERPRRANYVYGATKAGIDAFATGLGDELVGTGVSVLVVRPGFVHSSMTAGLPPAPFATTPDVVAAAIVGALGRGTTTIWVPGALRPLMSILRHLPRAVFRRLPQ